MGLPWGTLLDSVEILELIGAGGMGEVYRGRDRKLGRDVAVKMLPEALAQDPERLARFEREAQSLAALSHPNIAVIHDLKEANGSRYLILELIEGDTLAERIARGPIPIDEALALARQIAQALEAAHEKGIVHRDLKPANVKVTPEGRVKVLDFGLAKIYESNARAQNAANSPTLSGLQTGGGMIMGTAAYMSPEQARGKNVDRRADIWAFGCVLYEMIVGRQTFPNGETVTDTLAGILARDPDWQALPATTPARIRALLERCLRKDERQRLRDIGNARLQIEESRNETEALAVAAAAPAPSRRREMVLGALALTFLIATAGIAAALYFKPVNTTTVRFDAAAPANTAVSAGFSLSPDGHKIAYVTTTPAQIWIRSLADAEAKAIPSTEGAGGNFFWSPDSQYIGFFAEGKVKKVAATGGPAQSIGNLPAGGIYYGTWSDADVILIGADSSTGGPLLRVPAAGGDPKPATELDKGRMEQSHRYPNFLPDGRHFLYLATAASGKEARDSATYVGELDSKDRQPLEGIAAEAKYANGHLVFIRDGALMARPFSAGSRKFTGEPFTIADAFAPRTALTYPFSLSTTGGLAYRADPGSAPGILNTGATQLIWAERSGSFVAAGPPEGDYFLPELSPDGKTIAFTRGTPAQVWIMDLATGRTDQVTTDAAEHANPRWSPDGKTVAFDSTREGVANLYEHAVGLPGEDRLLFKSDRSKALSDWSRDGKTLIYVADGDIFAVPSSHDSKSGDPKPLQVTKTPALEAKPRISKDGRWIAYTSNERAGQSEVYIQSFPKIPGDRYPVSVSGGYQPRWTSDGTALLYVEPSPSFAFVAVAMNGTGSSPVGALNRLGSTGGDSGVSTRITRGIGSFNPSEGERVLLQATPGTLTTTATNNRGAPGNGTTNPGAGRTRGGITFILNWLGNRGR